jgi:ABC-type lipoprotein release transport system permease subunit
LTAGVGAALALSRLVQGLLFEVRAADPATIAVVCAAVLIVAVAACSIPARKALSGNPVAALRIE